MLATGDLSYIVILIVYGVDSILAIVHRLMLHENIFDARGSFSTCINKDK